MRFLRSHRTLATILVFVLAYIVIKVLSTVPLVGGQPS